MRLSLALLLGCLMLASPAVAQEANPPVTEAAPPAFLTNILRTFDEAFKRTSRAAAAGGTGLTIALLSWAVSQAAAKMALRAALSQYAWQFAAAVAYAMFAFNAPALAAWFADGLASMVSGGGHNGGILSNPSQLMTKAYTVTAAVFTQGMTDTSQTTGFVDTVKAIGSNVLTGAERFPVLLAGVFVVIGYWWTAVVGMKAVIYANAKILVGTALSPFLVLPITRPLGMGGVTLIVSAAAELAVQSAVVGIGFTVLQGMHLDANSDFQAIMQTALGACAVALVCSGLNSLVSFTLSTARTAMMFD